MKKKDYTGLICKGFCKYYKAGREEISCGTYDFLVRNVAAGELRSLIRDVNPLPDLSCDREIRALVCKQCDFMVDGCDFRQVATAPPCGGYTILEKLLK